jgi:7-cyano-7-deazaguanine synthase
MSERKAVVLLSGGLDSATCLAIAKERGFSPTAISFDYGQRHKNELMAAAKITGLAGVEHTVIAVDLAAIGGSALTDKIAVPKGGAHLVAAPAIPVTYVPVRNMIFLSLAYALAEARAADALFIGVNAIDYSGYPDCRPDFIESFAKTAALASKIGREGNSPEIIAPLVTFSKADIAREAVRLKVPVEFTWSCYDPQISNGFYNPCENCDACILRRNGFADAGLTLSKEEIFGSPIALE